MRSRAVPAPNPLRLSLSKHVLSFAEGPTLRHPPQVHATVPQCGNSAIAQIQPPRVGFDKLSLSGTWGYPTVELVTPFVEPTNIRSPPKPDITHPSPIVAPGLTRGRACAAPPGKNSPVPGPRPIQPFIPRPNATHPGFKDGARAPRPGCRRFARTAAVHRRSPDSGAAGRRSAGSARRPGRGG